MSEARRPPPHARARNQSAREHAGGILVQPYSAVFESVFSVHLLREVEHRRVLRCFTSTFAMRVILSSSSLKTQAHWACEHCIFRPSRPLRLRCLEGS